MSSGTIFNSYGATHRISATPCQFMAKLQLPAHNFSAAILERTQGQLVILQNASVYLQSLQNENNNTNITSFSKFIETALSHFEVINCTSPEIRKGLTHNGDYLDFLQRVTFASDTTGILQIRNMSRRHHWFEPLRNFLSWAEGQERHFCLQLHAKIENSIEKISKGSKIYFIQNFQKLESLGNQTELLHHLLNTLRDMASSDLDTQTNLRPSEIMFAILQKTDQLSPTVVAQNSQKHLNTIALFLDHCNAKFSTLNPLSWLHRSNSFIADVNSHLGMVQDAIQNKIRTLTDNLAKTLELHYQSRFKQYKNAKTIRALLQHDLDNFLNISNTIKKFSVSQNSSIKNIIDTQFLSRISSKINMHIITTATTTITIKNNSHYLNDEIKEQIPNLEFVRQYSTDFEINTHQGEGRKEDVAWLDNFTRVTTLVQKKYSALFRFGDRKMTNLMTDASSQLEHFFLSSFRQVQRQPSLHGDAFKRKIVLLLTRLEEIENLEVTEGEGTSILSPSQLVTKLLQYSSNQVDPSLSIFSNKLINEVNETSLVLSLDLVENWNQNMNNISIQNQNSLIPVTHQSLWLVNFKKFVPIVKRNFNIVSDAVEARISGLFQNLTEVIVSDYALQFERGAQFSSSKNEAINFRRSLQENLNAFQGVLENLNTAEFITNSSSALHSAAYDFVQSAHLDSAGLVLVQNILQQLFKMGQCLDFARNYVTVNIQPANWFIPLRKFVNALNTTVNNPFTCTNNFHPDKKVVIVKGTFVSIHQLLGHSNLTCLSPQTENIVIISLHTVYIDSDLIRRSIQLDPTRAKQLNIAIIAPNWLIVNKTTFNLDGDHGKSRSALLRPGQNGLPGLPGNNAGDFIGIGSTLITNNGTFGDKYLQVRASGGDGGGGQSGRDGSIGKDGENVTLDKIEFEVTQGGSLKNQVRLTKYEPFTMLNGYRNCWLILDFYRCTEFWFNGTLAEKGQDGGSGGAGGFGGQRGLLRLVGSLNFTRAFNLVDVTHNRDGNMGPGGDGGRGGRGGVHGFNGKVQIYPGKFDEGFSTDGKKLLQSDAQGVAADGEDGGRGLNRFGRQTPSKRQYSVAEHSFLVNQFRQYARQNLDNQLLQRGLNAFLNELDTQELSLTPVPTTALMDEFLDLESQELELQRKNISLLPLYERFLNKIRQLLNSNASSINTEKILTVLYTASLSRINSLSTSSISTPITDMTSYLNLAQKNLESFQRKSHNYNALSLIQNITRDHISPITKDIDLAQDFITYEITPDIRRLQTQLDSSAEKLLEEIVVLKLRISDETKNLTAIQGLLQDGVTQEATSFTVENMLQSQSVRQDLALLDKKRSGLKIKMIAHKVLEVLKTGSHFLCFFGPKGMIISMGLQSGLYGAQSLLGDVRGQEAQATAIYKETTREFLAKGIRQLVGFVTFLDDTKSKLMTYPNTFSGTIQEIRRIKIEANSEKAKLELQLSALDKQGIDIANVDSRRRESPMSLNSLDFIRFKKETIRAMLNSSTERITNTNTDTNNNNNTMIPSENEIIALTNLIYEDLQLNTEFYLKVKNDRSKIHEVTRTIQENEKELGQLEELALTVENRMALILAEFHGKMELYFPAASDSETKINQNIAFESATNVDIAQWHISRKLRAIKNLITSKFTKTYQVDDEIMMIFQKMDQAFTMLTQVYDRIAHFKKEAKLGYFISRINSIAFLQTSSSFDPVMQEKMLRVELGIVSRVIVGQYQRVIHSLKMATFPFAEFYLRNIDMPDKLVQLPDPDQQELLQNKHSINKNNRNQNRTENQKSSDLLAGELAEEASRILRKISDQVSLSKSTHNDILDHHLRTTSFVKTKSSVPFYVWEGSKFGFSIRKLLSGRSVSLTAGIRNSPRNYDAVKLSRIDVNFRAGAVTYNDSNESITSLSGSGSDSDSGELILKELQNELEHYQIKMTHLGNSAYRYDDKYYTIPTPPVSFTFSFQKDPTSGLPNDRNWAHLKWASGDILLSPYATWKMEIAPFDQSRNISILQTIAESKDFHVDLELVGKGTYVEKDLSSVLKIDDYYSADKDLSYSQY